ncbi:Sporulation protein YhaL [Salipaludibacillus aurantiacus]|uniref:Sporulation protein YhaL n=1 Tax=Salipaludibacillus aurantiacus TaxID=1601833 RepID=A0A1H9RMM7_9BACI|nr:Sporulation protein YhaL [Salipaludibacillus aurantiacus]
MNPLTVVFTLAGAVFMVIAIRIISLTSLGTWLFNQPWWIYFLLLGVIASGCMTIKERAYEKKKGEAPTFNFRWEPGLFRKKLIQVSSAYNNKKNKQNYN